MKRVQPFRKPFNISLKDLDFIIESIINRNINEDIINNYKLYYFNPETKIVLNEKAYYNNINENYFV